MIPEAPKLYNALQRNQKLKVTVYEFLLHLLDFVNNEAAINIVPDKDVMENPSQN